MRAAAPGRAALQAPAARAEGRPLRCGLGRRSCVISIQCWRSTLVAVSDRAEPGALVLQWDAHPGLLNLRFRSGRPHRANPAAVGPGAFRGQGRTGRPGLDLPDVNRRCGHQCGAGPGPRGGIAPNWPLDLACGLGNLRGGSLDARLQPRPPETRYGCCSASWPSPSERSTPRKLRDSELKTCSPPGIQLQQGHCLGQSHDQSLTGTNDIKAAPTTRAGAIFDPRVMTSRTPPFASRSTPVARPAKP